MKKFDLKSIFMGVVVGALATCGMSIASTLVSGDVYFNSFPIYLNGRQYVSKSPVLNYNGRTYLELNEYGTALGSNVSFNNNSIYINSNWNNGYNNGWDNGYNNNYYDPVETREEDIEIEEDESKKYYINLNRYGARSATISGENSKVTVNKTRFTYSSDLEIYGKKEGEATLRVTYNTGDTEILYVNVTSTRNQEIEDHAELEVGDSYKVKIYLDDYDADEAKVYYNSNYVDVSRTRFTSDGYLTVEALKEGSTTVKIKFDSGDTAYIYLDITDKNNNNNDNYDNIKVDVGDYEYVYIDLDDYDAKNATLTYNNSYLKVYDTYLTESQDVKIKGLDEGYTSIKVKFNTGEIVYIDVEVL